MLDEIDKVGADFRGDPSSRAAGSAGPGQNATFRDHYLDVPFDLSRSALYHHGERARHDLAAPARPHGIIEISGYTEPRAADRQAPPWCPSR